MKTTTERAVDLRRMKRTPTHPGEILLEEFLKPLGMSQRRLADHLGCHVKVVNRIVNGRSAVTAGLALKLGAAFRTSPEFWLNMQTSWDLWHAYRARRTSAILATRLERLKKEGVLVTRPAGRKALQPISRRPGALKRFLAERD